MAAPLAVLSATEKLAAAVSNDIIVLNGRVYRTVRVGRKKVLEPVDVQLHVNPVGIGAGLLAGAVGLFAASVAWNGIHVGFPGLEFDLVKGLKESPYWQGVVTRATRGKAGGDGDGGPPRSGPPATCAALLDRYNHARANADYTDAARAAQQAAAQGCPWASERRGGPPPTPPDPFGPGTYIERLMGKGRGAGHDFGGGP